MTTDGSISCLPPTILGVTMFVVAWCSCLVGRIVAETKEMMVRKAMNSDNVDRYKDVMVCSRL